MSRSRNAATGASAFSCVDLGQHHPLHSRNVQRCIGTKNRDTLIVINRAGVGVTQKRINRRFGLHLLNKNGRSTGSNVCKVESSRSH